MRRQFSLSHDDTTFLGNEATSWEAVFEGSAMWVLIHDYNTPEGYSPRSVSMAISIPPNYPDGNLDMVYFHPALTRDDKRHIPATEGTMLIDGKTYQRWSRHYTPQNPWISGVHSLETHFHTARTWLDRELRRV